MTVEKDNENTILQYLIDVKKVFCWPNETMGVFDPKKKTFRLNKNPYKMTGVSDILGTFKGRFLAIEVKTFEKYKYVLKHWDRLRDNPTNKDQLRLSNQIRFIEAIRANGGRAGFAHNIETAIEILNQKA